MSGTARLTRIIAVSQAFAAHHGLPSPGDRSVLTLGADVGEGGFGKVVELDTVDGAAPKSALLVKIFTETALNALPGGAPALAMNMKRFLRKLEHLPGTGWYDSLLAIPFCVTEAEVKGRTTLMSLMLDLRGFGYQAGPFGDTGALRGYLTRPLGERQELAFRFAEKAAILEEMGLVHGDINPENVMIRYAPPDVQIIDVDAGVLIERGDERPLTPGKADALMPPEVKKQTGTGQIDMSAFLPASERWSVGCLIGYLLFGAHPAFFLNEISAAAVDEYAQESPGWPFIDVMGNLFTKIPENRAAYPGLRQRFESVPPNVGEAFRQLFRAGLDANARPTGADWAVVLSTLCKPPEFVELALQNTWLLAGMATKLRWKAERATAVDVQMHCRDGSVGSLGRHGGHGELDVAFADDAFLVLEAHNAFGSAAQRTASVVVLPAPPIDSYRPPRPERNTLLQPVLLLSVPSRPPALPVACGWAATTIPASLLGGLVMQPPSLIHPSIEEVLK